MGHSYHNCTNNTTSKKGGDSFKKAIEGHGGGNNKNDDDDKPKDLKKIKDNKRANEIAEELGYKNAEALKDDYAQDNGAKFDMYRNTKTGEIILKSIQGGAYISTGLYC